MSTVYSTGYNGMEREKEMLSIGKYVMWVWCVASSTVKKEGKKSNDDLVAACIPSPPRTFGKFSYLIVTSFMFGLWWRNILSVAEGSDGTFLSMKLHLPKPLMKLKLHPHPPLLPFTATFLARCSLSLSFSVSPYWTLWSRSSPFTIMLRETESFIWLFTCTPIRLALRVHLFFVDVGWFIHSSHLVLVRQRIN